MSARCGVIVFGDNIWWSFAFHEFSLSPFAQALPLLFDSENAFEVMYSDESELRRDMHDGKPESLHLIAGFDEAGFVRCALGPSYLFEDSFEIPVWKAQELAFATAVQDRPYVFGAGVMQFLLSSLAARTRCRSPRCAKRGGLRATTIGIIRRRLRQHRTAATAAATAALSASARFAMVASTLTAMAAAEVAVTAPREITAVAMAAPRAASVSANATEPRNDGARGRAG